VFKLRARTNNRKPFLMAATKRTRTKKIVSEADAPDANNTDEVASTSSDSVLCEEPVAKKRGRKPRGSKIIEGCDKNDISNVAIPNVIVHFRCSITEIGTALESSCETADQTQDNTGEFSRFAEVKQSRGNNNNNEPTDNRKSSSSGSTSANATIAPSDTAYGAKGSALGFASVDEVDKQEILLDVKEEDVGMWMPQGDPRKACGNGCAGPDVSISIETTEINEKISEMEVNFHNNNTNGKRSSCFWDTCPFDTPPFYIPKAIDTNDVRPYGCFCSLNCALAYLQSEDIDSSAKFERRQLMFNLYSKVVGDKTFVKPAPNPRYTLDKYYGNLSIQQWRSFLAGDRMLLIVDKPLTPELPQLHTETTERFLTMGNTTTTDVAQYGKFKIRKVAPKQSKGAIVAERFGATK
jgi:hypothetical protein